MNFTEILVVSVVVGAVFLSYKAANKQRQNTNKRERARISNSNLDELAAKFKADYINQKLSEFASREDIGDELIQKIYPKYQKNLNNASIDWAKFSGKNTEIELKLTNYSGGGSTLYYKFENMLKGECQQEIDLLISKIKEIK